ncbi:Short-chain dehydrogenase/reductase aba4 [Paramyrothecium foliicola]|nr:Short-chain dehydrogenase/reductase aba4 [Paramyrothecium foliicola]
MPDLHGKVIAITGSSSGIGLATARHLAALGANISLADTNGDTLGKIHQELAAKYTTQKFYSQTLNVSNRQAVMAWIKETVDVLGLLDGAANVAGIGGKQSYHATIEDIDDDDFEFVMGVNFYGVLHCMREEIKNIRDGGSIVNMASVAGLTGVPRAAAYVSSKHAVVGLTRTAAKELGSRGVRVNAVAP